MTKRSIEIVRAAFCAAVLILVSLAAATEASAGPRPGTQRRRGFNLLASAELPINVNRIYCGVNNNGEVCVGLGGSAVTGGGVWPKGTPDQYIFNSGLQVAGIIPSDAGFAWANDTVGAYFMDPRGSQRQGEGLTSVYNSLDPADVAAWPNGGMVRDASLYDPVLLGRPTIAQQDIWVRSWDGNASLLSGRKHPMGVAVDIRGMGWNFPSGNEDIIYFLYTFYNVTATDPAKYSGLDPAIASEIAAIGQQFHDQVKSKLNVDVPAGGYRFDSLYAAFFMDPDVGDATSNYSTAILPFNLGIAYKADFLEPNWQFPPDIFGGQFAAAPGFIGVKYLKSPINPVTHQEVGLTMFSNTVNQTTGFPDPVGVVQLWRYLSGNVSAALGDNNCNVGGDPKLKKLCFLYQSDTDTRFYQSSGPFSLDAGGSATIVVAYVQGAPVAKWLTHRIGDAGANAPGVPPSGAEIATTPSLVRGIDSIAGWVSQSDANHDGVIDQTEVQTVPRSLLDKARVAQAVFDHKFLLPFAPEPPPFYLVPGENQVTIVWSKSQSETTGDPYFVVASNSDSTNALYDPNFRQFDVEGYRIYRGRTTGQLELIAQFDYSGTLFADVTGNFDYGNRCAPELGLGDSTVAHCPVDFAAGDTNFVDITSPFIQVKSGDRVLLADSTVFTVKADTAVTGGASGFPAMDNTGVPFAYVDKGVRNSFTYYYAVTAFDVNSIKSGPSSLESARITKSVTPRAPSPNEVGAQLVSGLFGDDGIQLDPGASWSIDAAKGKFTGPPPPTDALAGVLTPMIPQLLPALNLNATIDSVVPLSFADFDCGDKGNDLGLCYRMYVTFKNGPTTASYNTLVNWPYCNGCAAGFSTIAETQAALGSMKISPDPAAAARYGVPATTQPFTASASARFGPYINFTQFEGHAARRNIFGNGAGISAGGSRWFDGTNESVDHPGIGIRIGHVGGADTIWAPISHTDTDPNTTGNQQYAQSTAMQCLGYDLGALGRQADVQFTWGAGGTISSVRDLTHHVNVPFNPTPEATYGFIGDANADGVISWDDFQYMEFVSQANDDNIGLFGFCGHTDPGPGARAQLVANPVIMSVSVQAHAPGTVPTSSGTGFGLYANGQPYIFVLTGGAAPAANTKWTLRTYSGSVSASTGAGTATPSGYSYKPALRSPGIPNLSVGFKVTSPSTLAEETDSTLQLVHTVPDPYYVTSSLEASTNTKILKFVNLPPKAIIRIYSVSGVLVQVLTHNDVGLGGEQTWNLRSRNNQFVASGVYFYHVESASGKSKIGRFTVVNFAQ